MAGIEWTWLVGGYFALAGVGAGAYLASATADLVKSERYKPLVKPGFYISLPTAALGAILLVLDLGRPERFMNVFNSPDTSILSLGAYLLTIFVPLSFVTAVIWALAPRIPTRMRVIIEMLGGIFAFGVALYIGLLLGAAAFRPLWLTPALPWLLFISSMSMGLTAIGLALLAYKDYKTLTDAFRGLHKNDLILLVLLAIAIVGFLATNPDPEGVSVLLTGAMSAAFYGGVLLIGIIIPAAIDLYALRRDSGKPLGRSLIALGLALPLAGGVILRFVILFAAQL